MRLTWGDVPVPYVASWSAEERFFLGQCPHAGRMAIRQDSAPGVGKPIFGKPHSDRQREAVSKGLCDLCGRSLKTSTKVSLSHARPIAHSAGGWEILQIQPLLHRQCAAISAEHCPSLKRDIKDGSIRIRQVTNYRVQFAVMDAEYTLKMTGKNQTSIGHAKVELGAWIDRDLGWLLAEYAGKAVTG